MQLVNQHVKKIMEGCKERARAAGLRFEDETLEYLVTNRNLIELTPKHMIPTLYDYWVHDVQMLKGKGEYELYPHNPYETVINSRPPISYYNDNNPDWMNVAIFYHVIGHIDFFQNNAFFRNTWDDDFVGQALADKRLIARFRSEHGHWVDYVLEFGRGLDNLVGYFHSLANANYPKEIKTGKKVDYFFDVFLQHVKKLQTYEYLKYIEQYNEAIRKNKEVGEEVFFADMRRQFPEFESLYEKNDQKKKKKSTDVLEFIIDHSEHLQKEENQWMKIVLHVVRNTSMFFQPQIITKIFNEGWASYWHEKLYYQDERIKGHEVDFAKFHAGVTALPRVGLNPYATGIRLLYYLEDKAQRGQLSYDFERLADRQARKDYNKHTNKGQDFLFKLREDFCDFTLINNYIDQDFVDKYHLFVAGKRLNRLRQKWQYYIKSRKAADYKKMLVDSLYHPPQIRVDVDKSQNGELYLMHDFEGKQLVPEFIPNTMLGAEYLWGKPVKLETTEIHSQTNKDKLNYKRVLFTMRNRQLTKKYL
jgi:stage V sporulation protein R